MLLQKKRQEKNRELQKFKKNVDKRWQGKRKVNCSKNRVKNKKSYFLNRISNVHIHPKMLNYHTVKKCVQRKGIKEEIEEWIITIKAVWFTRVRFLEE